METFLDEEEYNWTMHDPIRIKNKGRSVATVKYEDQNEPTNLHEIINADVAKKIPQEILEEQVKSRIEKISIKPGSEMKSIYTAFSYSENSPMEDFNFGNIFIEANLPYCLKFPNFSEVNIKLVEDNIDALVTMRKIWTNRAQTSDGSSDEVDIYTDDVPIYFKKSTIVGPVLPFRQEEGWDSYITGTNIEKINDKNGTFRYTKLYIQFDLNMGNNIQSINKKLEKVMNQIHDICLNIINRMIDSYRLIADEPHIRRLSSLKINLVYFTKLDNGFYVIQMPVRTAVANRSKKDFEKFADDLESNTRYELYKLLILNAKDSFNSKDFTLAIVEIFQALEIFIDNYLISEFVKNNYDEAEYKKILEKNWRTKDKLNIVLKKLKGKSLNEAGNLWNRWCLIYENIRNEVIHYGKEPDEKETSETIEIVEKVIKWVSDL